MTENYALEFEQTIKLNQHGRVTLADAADAILALERLTRRTPHALNRWTGWAPIEQTDFFLKKLEEGSLLHDYIVKIFFGSKEREDQFCAWLRDKTGIDKSNMKTLFAILGTGVIAAGATVAVQRFATPATPPQAGPTVMAWNNTIIQVGASELRMEPEEFAMVIEKAMTRRTTAAKDVARLLKPAKARGGSGTVEIGNETALVIPSEVVAWVPTPEEIDDRLPDREVTYPGVDIFLRATDLDNSQSGWAALIPLVTDKRLKMELGEGVRPEDLFGKTKVVGDIDVVLRASKTGERTPVRYRLKRLEPNE